MALHHVGPGEVADLNPYGEQLADAKTNTIAKTNAFQAIRMIVRAGSEIPAHQVPGELTLQCIEGRISLRLDEQTIDIAAGQWVYLEGGKRHLVKGIENSLLLLTILFPR